MRWRRWGCRPGFSRRGQQWDIRKNNDLRLIDEKKQWEGRKLPIPCMHLNQTRNKKYEMRVKSSNGTLNKKLVEKSPRGFEVRGCRTDGKEWGYFD